MLISKIGEFGLIERFKKKIRLDASVIKGPGDDCAVVKFNKTHYMLLTCDMLIEGVDFTAKTDPYLVGRKALAVSLSDIAACGGEPRYALVSLGLPKESSLKLTEEIVRGILSLAKKYNVNIVGGDLSRAKRITLDVSVTGLVEKDKLVLRNGALPGDIIFVSGPLGGSIKGKHLHFTPRIKEAKFLVSRFHPHAMIDISDGLIQDLRHITEESKVGASLHDCMIPVSKEAKNFSDALYSGEDFELLFTLSPKEAVKILKIKPVRFFPIGKIVPKKYGFKMFNCRGRQVPLENKGYRHF